MYDTIVIGGGPAGMTAALYLRRANKTVLIIEKDAIGGQIAESPRLENFPSISSISGMDFANNLFEQIMNLGAELEIDEVKEVNKNNDSFTVITKYSRFESKTIVIATGCKHRKLGIEGEDRLAGKGVSYCAVCDGAFYKDKDVVLIGDANTACQYAISLAETSKNVYLITLFDKFFADQILVDRIKNLPNVFVSHNMNSISFNGENALESVTFRNTQTNEIKTIPCEGAFVAIGQIPCNEIFSKFVELEKGFIVTNEQMETSTPKIYAVGDCRVKNVRQVITATNDGAVAALSIINKLN